MPAFSRRVCRRRERRVCNAAVARSPAAPRFVRTTVPRPVLADRACNSHCCGDESAAAAAAGRLGTQLTIRRAARAWDPKLLSMTPGRAKTHRAHCNFLVRVLSYSCGTLFTLCNCIRTREACNLTSMGAMQSGYVCLRVRFGHDPTRPLGAGQRVPDLLARDPAPSAT